MFEIKLEKLLDYEKRTKKNNQNLRNNIRVNIPRKKIELKICKSSLITLQSHGTVKSLSFGSSDATDRNMYIRIY